MNCSTYFFAKTNSATAYYPSDNSNCEVFDKFIRESQEGWQLCIARNGNLMYYAVVKKESAKCYYGLCVLVNNIIFTDIKSVYQIIAAYLNQIANDGVLIVWYSGILIELDFTVQKNVNYVENVLERLRLGIENVHDYAQLPAQDYSRDVDSIVHMKDIDDNDELLKSTYSNGFTFIHISRTEGTKIAETNNREKENSKLKGEKADLERQNEELRSEIRSLKIANIKLQLLKRNYVPIVLSCVALIGLLFMIYKFVWYPSEAVNKYYPEFGYTYSGPLENGLPSGVGMAVYPNDDEDDRMYYVGGFEKGYRTDTARGNLIYNDGSLMTGKWDQDFFMSGLKYNRKEKFIYNGYYSKETFDSYPSTGDYFKLEKYMSIKDGEQTDN